MKKLLLFLSAFVLISITLSAQDTIVCFKFNTQNSNLETFGNSFNTNRVITREAGFNQTFSFPAGMQTYGLSSTSWVNGADSAKGYYTSFSTVGLRNIHVSSVQNSSPTGPKYFKLQYKADISGTWTDVNSDTIKCFNPLYYAGHVYSVLLPSTCENNQNVFSDGLCSIILMSMVVQLT
jgi:hypothetical protein